MSDNIKNISKRAMPSSLGNSSEIPEHCRRELRMKKLLHDVLNGNQSEKREEMLLMLCRRELKAKSFKRIVYRALFAAAACVTFAAVSWLLLSSYHFQKIKWNEYTVKNKPVIVKQRIKEAEEKPALFEKINLDKSSLVFTICKNEDIKVERCDISHQDFVKITTAPAIKIFYVHYNEPGKLFSVAKNPPFMDDYSGDEKYLSLYINGKELEEFSNNRLLIVSSQGCRKIIMRPQ